MQTTATLSTQYIYYRYFSFFYVIWLAQFIEEQLLIISASVLYAVMFLPPSYVYSCVVVLHKLHLSIVKRLHLHVSSLSLKVIDNVKSTNRPIFIPYHCHLQGAHHRIYQ